MTQVVAMALSAKSKTIPIVCAILGLFVTAALIAAAGTASVGDAALAFGWSGFSALCLIHLAVTGGMGLAWRGLVPKTPVRVMIWGRLVRDAVSEITPLSQLGGLAAGARAVVIAGVPAATAAATTVVDVTLEFLSKIAYLALGWAWLIQTRPASPIVLPLSLGLALIGLLGVALCVVQRHGFGIFERFASAVARGWASRLAAGAAVLRAALTETYVQKPGILAGFCLHLACWIGSAFEVWVALRFAGVALDFGAVLAMESILYGIRTFAAAIPNAIGVQEATYVLIGTGLGLTPETGLALSLLKRARDLAIGVPILAAWQAIEGRRLWRRRLRAKL